MKPLDPFDHSQHENIMRLLELWLKQGNSPSSFQKFLKGGWRGYEYLRKMAPGFQEVTQEHFRKTQGTILTLTRQETHRRLPRMIGRKP